ncbi:MAG: metallophosphoesterase family protein, partial [Caldilineaceae bacterium]|nr:metallophosphoesterase family protein [Caldilineaceae bacterium]
MRVALLADIHGNLFAFEAVLQALAARRIDQIICLGDVAIFGPQPREALIRLQAAGCSVVMGNTDAWALDPKPHPYRNEQTPYINAIELWGADQLANDDLAYIRSFQPTVNVELDNQPGVATLLCYHGSPRSFHDSIVATTPIAELAPMFRGQDALILAGGHTHQQYLRRYHDKYLLNPGSVGRAYEIWADGTAHDSPWAEYALVEWCAGNLRIDLRRVAYDV